MGRRETLIRFGGKPAGKKQLGTPSCRWQSNVK
jgi:hypothetical protein